MSAGVTYEGAVQRSGGTATLFQGKRLWLAHRVPTRSTLVDYIKSNGGQLEPLEKNADYLIADHAKPHSAPANAITWKWIQDSVMAKRLLDANEYLINEPKAKPSQPSPGPQGIKKGRTPFTDEDDKLLIAFVRQASKKDRSILGLEIYKEFAGKNPRHTFHSWRDRWAKKLQYLDGVLDGPVLPSTEPAGGRPDSVPPPPPAEQSLDANPNTAANPSRPSAATESPRPNAVPKSRRPRPAAASPRPSVVRRLSQPKVAPMRLWQSAAAESPCRTAPPDHMRAASLRPNASPEHAKSSTVAESSRPRGTPEHAKPRAVVEPPRPSAVPTSSQPTVPPGYVPSGVTPQPSRPSAAPEFPWSSGVAPQATPVNTVMRSPELSSTLKRKSIFTEEEDILLTEYVQEMWTERGKDADASLDIFADLEWDLPQHSARVWRHRWIRYLRPRLFPPGYGSEGPTATETPQAGNATEQPQVDTAGLSSPVPPTKHTTPDPAGQKQYHDDMSEPSLGADPGYMDEEEDIEDVPAGGSSPLLDHVACQRTTSHAFAEPPDHPVSERQLFARDYEVFWYANGDRRERFNSWPTIRGRTFDLFDLWKAATSQHAIPAERNWDQIAEDLGFNWIELDGVQYELANFFEEHLGEFEELMADFDDEEESTEEDEIVATPEAEMPGEQSETGVLAGSGPSRQPFNSSPPKLPSLKRTQGAASLSYPEVEPKRRRFDRSTEISSTPDHKNGTAHLRKSSVSAAVSPIDQRISTLPRSSLSPKTIRQAMDSPSARGTKRAVAEPATQGFHYDPATQNAVSHGRPSAADWLKSQSEADVTASQQLTLESEGFVELTSSPRTSKKPQGAAHPSPLRRQVAKDPFVDSPDDEPPAPTPKPRFGKGRNPLLPAPAPTVAKKRRSLPWAEDGEVGPHSRPAKPPAPGPVTATVQPRFIRPPRSDEPSSPAARVARTPGAQAGPLDGDAAPIPTSCDPREIKYLRSVLRDWERRGYARDVALRGLDLTTWATDISGDVIELLQRGEPVPDDWFGVWTEVDDGRLAIVDGREFRPPKISPERLERRRQRAIRHLEAKFDAEGMVYRRHWLSIKNALQEANIEL